MGIIGSLSGIPRPAVFLDRDGVINAVRLADGKPYPPQSVEAVVVLDGVTQAIRLLDEAGYVCVVVTNQPDLARGSARNADVEAIHVRIADLTGLQHFYTCPHDDSDRCDCRKPLPGLLLRAARELDLDLDSSFMVGDRWRDVEAGKSAGVRCFYIDYGYSERPAVGYDWVVASLSEAASIILAKHQLVP